MKKGYMNEPDCTVITYFSMEAGFQYLLASQIVR